MTRGEEQFLVAQAQQDSTKFDALYRAYVNEIYRFVFYKTSAKIVAEDLTAQVFMQALEHLDRFRYQSGARFSSWLYTIARNKIIDHYRQARPTVALDEAEPIVSPETTSQVVDQHLQQKRVQEVLQQLPEADREILQLRLWEDKDYTEIGHILRINAIAVRARFSRAQKKFGKLYTKQYGTLN